MTDSERQQGVKPNSVAEGPVRIESPSGLSFEVNRNGAMRRMGFKDLVLNLFPGNELEGGPGNLWLRRHGDTLESVPLLGPHAPGAVAIGPSGLSVRGTWHDVRFAVALVLAKDAPAWFWHVRLENAGAAPVRVDLVHAQDVALAAYAAIRMNEYYVSQYLDHQPLVHPARGTVVAVRQNLSMGGRIPWALFGALGRTVKYATDALQLHGLTTRAGAPPAALAGDLPDERLQHEHAMVCLQDEAIDLAPGASVERGFFAWLENDHPAATSDADIACVARALALPEASPPDWSVLASDAAAPVATTFSTSALLAGEALDEAELHALYPGAWREVERRDGALLSFFTDAQRHVVLPAKERASLRPTGQIVRTGDRLEPDEASLTSTVWMDGVFHSLVTQGHVNINRTLSTVRSYLGLFRTGGQRVFVDLATGLRLLGVPSAFDMSPGSARWIYKFAGNLIRIESTAATARHELGLRIEVVQGPERRFVITHHVAIGGDDGLDLKGVAYDRDGDAVLVKTIPETELGWRFPQGRLRIAPDVGTTFAKVGDDAALFADGRSRNEPFLVVETAPSRTFGLRITGELVADDAAAASSAAQVVTPALDAAARDADRAAEDAHWRALSGSTTLRAPQGDEAAHVTRLHEILPWFAHDAMIHFLAPRGLEQYSGGGWGARDVTQGPVELLLALGKTEPMRELLRRVYIQQNPDGDWPQWFMFFPRDRGIRPDDSHGDIVYWPVLALAQYLLASDDGAFLDVELPFFDQDESKAERTTVWGHVERALQVIQHRHIDGTSLAAYGHGDWNDALQPVDPVMRERLCSSWTVTLQVQTLETLAKALRHVGRAELATPLDALAQATRADFQRLLLPDGTLAGFAWFHEDGRVEYLAHPSDRTTGLGASLLPMIHAIINELLTPEQAEQHAARIRDELLAADGARLFDKPPVYRGGVQRIFQRAETSTYFGREIGLMYTHAHLRYAEAMARHGDADAFWLAIRKGVPIGLRDVVSGARLRQANCYTSSSDPAFADRYEAQERYREVYTGEIPFEGGWRVYSSGAGIAFRLIHERLLGLRRARSFVVVDPVLPRVLDGLAIETELGGRPVRVEYVVGARGAGPVKLMLNDAELPFTREPNAYRNGGAVIAMDVLRERLAPAGDVRPGGGLTSNLLRVELA
jgi:cellobiose phosphorylase